VIKKKKKKKVKIKKKVNDYIKSYINKKNKHDHEFDQNFDIYNNRSLVNLSPFDNSDGKSDGSGDGRNDGGDENVNANNVVIDVEPNSVVYYNTGEGNQDQEFNNMIKNLPNTDIITDVIDEDSLGDFLKK